MLPRIGAVVFLLGVAYLIGLGISRGWITPLVQFLGAVAVCLAFVAVGLLRRDEREEFGQLLAGVGSCGLYISFAGGHAWQKLYSAEALVALFITLSILNLAFSYWRGSRTFLGIGMLGGFFGVLMPMEERQFATTAILHFAILVPSAVVAARYRWMYAGPVIWVLALPTAVAVSGSPLAWQAEVLSILDPAVRVVVLMFVGIAMIAGGYWYIRSRRASGEA